MHRFQVLLTLGGMLTACSAQLFLLPGTVYNGINGACLLNDDNVWAPSSGEESYAVEMIVWPSNALEGDPAGAETARANIAQYFDNKGAAAESLSNYTSLIDGLRMWFLNITNVDACGVQALAGVSISPWYFKTSAC